LTPRQLIDRGVSAWERGDYRSALEDFQEVLETHPGFPDIHNKAGLCLAMIGDLEGALQEFDEALTITDTYAEAHLNRAIVLQELGRFSEAREDLRRADELDRADESDFPSDVGHRIAMAHAKLGDLYLVADHPEEAAAHYRKALGVRSRFVDIRSKFAEALIEMGRWDEAQEQLETILEINPAFTSARLRLGVVLLRKGDEAGARQEWERCQDEDPGDMRARAYLAAVRGDSAPGDMDPPAEATPAGPE
jgi:tetratricopeptide (TPR) repeat protein